MKELYDGAVDALLGLLEIVIGDDPISPLTSIVVSILTVLAVLKLTGGL